MHLALTTAEVFGSREELDVPTYRMTYGDETTSPVTETFDDVEVEREDGLVVLFRGKEAILRLREEHVHSLERVDDTAP